jgi:NADH dehydrogenase/NADH:ubiquinone oxidoreductase subunit G
MAEKIGPIFNRILIKKLDQALDNGTISKKDYNDLKKKYFGKPKLIQMDLFDPKKKKQGGLMAPKKTKKSLKVTVNLPATEKKKKGPAGGPQKKQKPQKALDKLLKKFKGMPSPTYKVKPKLEKEKLLPERKVPPGEKPNMLDVAGGAKTVNVKKGGLMEATKRLKAQGLKKGGFPDLSGDGKVTMKDVLMGRGVIKKPKKKAMGGSMTLEKGKLKGIKDAPEERRREKIKRVGKAIGMLGAIRGALKGSGKVAGRAAKRGYGIAKK